jgi:C-terminal processing protease CtpA/Prc
VTYVYEGGPAHRCGLQLHDKLLQVNGHDFTVLTHRKAVEYIKRKPVLNMLVYRKGLPQFQKPQPQMMNQMQQYQQQQYQPQMQQQQQYAPQVGAGQFRQY